MAYPVGSLAAKSDAAARKNKRQDSVIRRARKAWDQGGSKACGRKSRAPHSAPVTDYAAAGKAATRYLDGLDPWCFACRDGYTPDKKRAPKVAPAPKGFNQA
jgi:hypothetical protein